MHHKSAIFPDDPVAAGWGHYGDLRPEQIMAIRARAANRVPPVGGTLEWHSLHAPIGLDSTKARKSCEASVRRLNTDRIDLLFALNPHPWARPKRRLVPGEGLEPSHPRGRWILSPLRLPIPPPGPRFRGKP